MTSAAIPSLAPLLEVTPAILRLAIPRLAPIVATALLPEIAIPLLVVGASYAAFQTLYYWSKANNDAIQAKAAENYCTLNPDDSSCGAANFTGGQSVGRDYRVALLIRYRFTFRGGDIVEDTRTKQVPGAVLGAVNNRKFSNGGAVGVEYSSAKSGYSNERYGENYFIEYDTYTDGVVDFESAQITSITTVDGQPDTGGNLVSTPNFSDLSPEKQQIALQSLSDSDWRSVIASTSARQLQEGETINQPVILTGDPTSTIPQERIPNIINFPGTVPAVAANPGIYIPATQDNAIGLSVPGVQNIPNVNQGETIRIQTQTGYIEVSPTGRITIVGSPSTPLPATAAPANVGSSDLWKELQDIKNLIGILPIAGAAVLAPAMTRIPSLSQVGSAAETATCNVVSGKSPCSGNPLPSMNNKLDDLIRGLGLAAEAGQGAILQAINNTVNTVNSKLGAQIPGIGIGGKLSNFVNWSVADRVTGLVTMFASLHNTMMLTNSVKETFLDVLDNLLNTGYKLVPNLFKKADEDAAIDSREYIGGAINTFFGRLFGVAEWSALQQQWKAYNTIYSSSTNAYDNLRSIHNDSQEILNRLRKDTGELGNALVDEGIISEDNWEYRDTDKRVKSKSLMRLERMNQGLEALDTKLEALEQVTQLVLNITNTAKEIKENADEIGKAFKDADKAATLDRNTKVEGLEVPNFNLVDFLDGD